MTYVEPNNNFEILKPLGHWVFSFEIINFEMQNGRYEFRFNKEILN